MRLFFMNSGQARTRLVQAGSVLAAAVLVAGCGSAYRPVVTPINPSGPAQQPQSFAVVVSVPSSSTAGIATIIDYAGDTVLAQAPIGPGPSVFTLDGGGFTGYTVDSDGTISNFPVSQNLQAKQVTYTTLASSGQAAPPHPPANMFTPSVGMWNADQGGGYVDFFSSSPEGFKLAIPVTSTPVTVAGPSSSAQRNYAIIQKTSSPTGVECNLSPAAGPDGEADAIESTSDTISAQIPVGKCPVYALSNSDGRRFFVLNRGDDTITVINSQNNTLDACTPFVNQTGQTVTCHPALPLSLTAVAALNKANPGSGNPPNGTAGMGTIAGPVYAEYNSATSQLIVANFDGNSISVIDVSLDQFGNDSATFGTTFNIPLSSDPTKVLNPASVTVLADGSRAYTANQTDGTVTIANLSSHTVERTLPVIGHPRTVVSTQNSEYGKVYAAAPDSPYLTIIRTDQDIVDTTVLVEGNILDVRVTTQNTTSGNSNAVSRTPGFGQPCNLANIPGGYAGGIQPTSSLANCAVQDPKLLK